MHTHTYTQIKNLYHCHIKQFFLVWKPMCMQIYEIIYIYNSCIYLTKVEAKLKRFSHPSKQSTKSYQKEYKKQELQKQEPEQYRNDKT